MLQKHHIILKIFCRLPGILWEILMLADVDVFCNITRQHNVIHYNFLESEWTL